MHTTPPTTAMTNMGPDDVSGRVVWALGMYFFLINMFPFFFDVFISQLTLYQRHHTTTTSR